MSADTTLQGHAGHHGGADSGKAVDPVCGMSVTKEGAKHVATYEGQTYYFCCNGCLIKFMANPSAYLKKAEV